MSRMRGLTRWLREPLLHFLLLGALLFAAYAWVGKDEGAPDEILVSAATVAGLAQTFQRTWQRPPTQVELDNLVAEHVKEEIFYREALAAGLERDDMIIRRRLRQKLEFLSEDLASQVEPTDAELIAYVKAHAERYEAPARLDFAHVYFSSDRRGTRAGDDAARALARLSASPQATADFGDPFPLALQFEGLAADEADRLFGDGFSARLAQLPRDRWAGPVPSSYGLHLVRVTVYEPAAQATLQDAREKLTRDWQAEQRRQATDRFYESLRAQYTVRVEQAPEVEILKTAQGSR
jgi:hypothetical protein